MRRNGHRNAGMIGRLLGRPSVVARSAATLLACLAILLQAFIVQTHVHGVAGFDAAAGLERSASPASVATGHHSPAHLSNANDDALAPCVICQTLASAGNTLLAQATALTPGAAQLLGAEAAAIRRVVARPGYSWQSRAPPITL